MTFSRRSFFDFLIRLRYFARFRRWPTNLPMARLNLKMGREMYILGTFDGITGVHDANYVDAAPNRPIGIVTNKNDDGTYTVRVSGKVDVK